MTDAELRLACLDRAMQVYQGGSVAIADLVKCADRFYAFAKPVSAASDRGPDGRFKKTEPAPDPVNFADDALAPASFLHRAFGKVG